MSHNEYRDQQLLKADQTNLTDNCDFCLGKFDYEYYAQENCKTCLNDLAQQTELEFIKDEGGCIGEECSGCHCESDDEYSVSKSGCDNLECEACGYNVPDGYVKCGQCAYPVIRPDSPVIPDKEVVIREMMDIKNKEIREYLIAVVNNTLD